MRGRSRWSFAWSFGSIALAPMSPFYRVMRGYRGGTDLRSSAFPVPLVRGAR
jgi:hypothetical protein